LRSFAADDSFETGLALLAVRVAWYVCRSEIIMTWPKWMPRALIWFGASSLVRVALALVSLRTAHPMSSGRDGHHYLAIAVTGYDESNVVFPPLYPWCVEALAWLLPPEVAAFTASVLPAGVATVLFGLLVWQAAPTPGDDRRARADADFGVVAFTFASYAWLHMSATPGSEAVGMMTLLGAILLFKRGWLGWGAVCLGAASLSRVTFFMFAPYFAWLAYRRRHKPVDLLYAGAAGVGGVAQHLIGWAVFGELVSIAAIQRAQWGSWTEFPFSVYLDLAAVPYAASLVAKVTGVLVAYVVALTYLRKTEWLLQGAPLLFVLVSLNSYAFFGYGFDRQAIPILAPFVALVEVTRHRPRWRWVVLVVLIALALRMSVALTLWQGNRAYL
jgi:hypothetical protein